MPGPRSRSKRPTGSSRSTHRPYEVAEVPMHPRRGVGRRWESGVVAAWHLVGGPKGRSVVNIQSRQTQDAGGVLPRALASGELDLLSYVLLPAPAAGRFGTDAEHVPKADRIPSEHCGRNATVVWHREPSACTSHF